MRKARLSANNQRRHAAYSKVVDKRKRLIRGMGRAQRARLRPDHRRGPSWFQPVSRRAVVAFGTNGVLRRKRKLGLQLFVSGFSDLDFTRFAG